MAKYREKEFSVHQKRALKELYSRLPDITSKDASAFLFRYISFEAVARKVWNYNRKIINKSATDSHSAVPAPSLKKALNAFGIQLNEIVIDRLLSSDLKKRGSMSARQLRNEIIHQWKAAACKEVENRFSELDDDITLFLDRVKTQGQF